MAQLILLEDGFSDGRNFGLYIDETEVDKIQDILNELERAETKFPTWPDNIIEQAAIVSEESGELIRAALQVKYEGGNIEDCRKEAVQTAAMCIRFLKNLK